MSNEIEQEVPVKRKRGNPNFGKKKVDPVVVDQTIDPPESGKVYNYRYVNSESDIWLRLYTAILGTYNSPGVGPIKQAATYADTALQEYNNRYRQ